MTALLIKNVPPPLHERLKEEAQKHHRSMTKEALFILEQGLGPETGRSLRDTKAVPCRIRVDDRWIKQARNRGRS